MAADLSIPQNDVRRSIIPPLLAPRTFPRAYATVLFVFAAAFAGEWVVHQVEYLIQYGRHFGTVMAITPHRYYMEPLGTFFAGGALLALALTALVLRLHHVERQRLHRLLPVRLRGIDSVPYAAAPSAAIARTGLVLAGMQIAIYVVQENLEATAVGVPMPGLGVLIGPQHATVIPLHLLAAAALSLVLWTIVGFVRRSFATVQRARTLVRLFVPNTSPLPEHPPIWGEMPDREFVARARSLRSPPLAA